MNELCNALSHAMYAKSWFCQKHPNEAFKANKAIQKSTSRFKHPKDIHNHQANIIQSKEDIDEVLVTNRQRTKMLQKA
ncbi:hypothetical protein PSY51_23705, partial [Shigella flexneri]|nr:hypothetical protein [Shigella flexneri]